MKPKVTLVNHTPYPLETVWILWEASKTDGPLPTFDAVKLHEMVSSGMGGEVVDGVRIPSPDDMAKLFWDVLRQHIPIGEHINFVFMLEGVSVSFREQMVRHRIGTHVGDRVGVDIVPDQHDSTWWSQSMRIQDMGTFHDRGLYRVPDTLKGKTIKSPNVGLDWADGMPADQMYDTMMSQIQHAYNALVQAGVPMEDARDLIPLGAQHRISWGLTMQALLHILGKRGCWILQLGLWGPIIQGMVDELATKVHPMFRRIVAPPCIDQDNKFKSCLYRLENIRRMPQDDGSVPPDCHAPCPLYACRDEMGNAVLSKNVATRELNWLGAPVESNHQDGSLAPELARNALLNTSDLIQRQSEMIDRAEAYRKLWGHDPYTWE